MTNQHQPGHERVDEEYSQRTTGQDEYGRGATGGQEYGRGTPGQSGYGQGTTGQDEYGQGTMGLPERERGGANRGVEPPREAEPSGTAGGVVGGPGSSFEAHLTDELWIALEDFSELSHVAAWCATECATDGPELGICAQICQDVAEIAALNEMLIARDSMFGPEVADLFVRVANEALPELRRFDDHPHVAETIATLERTTNSCETVLGHVVGGMGSGMGGGQRAESGGTGAAGTGQRRHGHGATGEQY